MSYQRRHCEVGVITPEITDLTWGTVEVDGCDYRDAKIWPGGSREWDWRETDTHHEPGIQIADAQELLDKGAEVVVLSRGYHEVLQVPEETVSALEARGIEVHVAQSEDAVELVNVLRATRKVGALIHSTC